MSKIYFHKKNNTWYFNAMVNGIQYHRSSRQTTIKGARVVADQFVQGRMMEASAAALRGTALVPPPPPPVITLKKLVEKWEAAQDEETSAGHLRNVRDHVRIHLKDLHDTEIDQIGIEEIQPLVKDYRKTHSIPSTNGLRRTINLLFSFALKAKFLKERPFDALKRRKEPTKKRVALTEDQYGALTDSVRKSRNPHIPLMVVILIGTGVRRCDVLQMRWSDLDLDQEAWAPDIIKDGDPLFFQLNSWVIEELRKLDRLGPYVFCRITGEPHGDEFLRRALVRAGKDLGVGRLGTHSLRSAFITFLANNGVPIPTISHLVGHSDVRLTMKYFVKTRHALDEGMRVAQGISRAATAHLAPKVQAPTSEGTTPSGTEGVS